HVAVGVVTFDPVSQPENLPDPEEIAEPALDLRFGEARIAVGIEETLLAGEQRPRAVHLDAAPLEHHPRAQHRQAELFGDAGWNRVVLVARGILAAPGVE